MTFFRTTRIVAGVVAVSCMAVPAAASAFGASDAAQSGGQAQAPASRSDAAQSGVTAPGSASRSDAAQSGSTAKSAFPPAGFRGGDRPSDHPGVGEPVAAPTTIEVVRPERTIIRDVDETLPLILSSTALLIVLAGAGAVIVRTRMVPRAGRTH